MGLGEGLGVRDPAVASGRKDPRSPSFGPPRDAGAHGAAGRGREREHTDGGGGVVDSALYQTNRSPPAAAGATNVSNRAAARHARVNSE